MNGIRISEAVNDYNTPVSVHFCFGCGSEFTVCPPFGDAWGGCLAETCSTYDPARDADKLFDEAPWMIRRRDIR